MPGAREILLVTLLPLIVSALALAGGLLLSKNSPASWTAPLAIGAGFVAGHLALERPGFPPQDAFNWLAYMAIAITLAGVILATLSLKQWLDWIIAFILAIALMWLTLSPYSGWDRVERIEWTGGAAIVAFLTFLSLRQLSRRNQSASMAWIMAACAGFTALVLGMSDSQKFLLISAALAFALVPSLFLGGTRWRKHELWRGLPLVFVLIWLGLLTNGHFWSNLKSTSAIGLLIAPHAAWLAELPALRRLRPWQVNTIRVGLVLAVLLAVTVPVAIQFEKDTRAFRNTGGEDY